MRSGRPASPAKCFNPSRGIAIIQTAQCLAFARVFQVFQSLTRDSNHSNSAILQRRAMIVMFQSLTRDSNHSNLKLMYILRALDMFQSLTRDSNHSNLAQVSGYLWPPSFNPSRGIAIIQTDAGERLALMQTFQSLTRDSNHSNVLRQLRELCSALFQSLTRDSNHSNRTIARMRGA